MAHSRCLIGIGWIELNVIESHLLNFPDQERAALGLKPRPEDAMSSTPQVWSRGELLERRGVQTSCFHHPSTSIWEGPGGRCLQEPGCLRRVLRMPCAFSMLALPPTLFPSLLPPPPPPAQTLAFWGLKSSHPFHCVLPSPRPL